MAQMNEVSLEEEQAIKERCKDSNKGRFEGGMTLYDCPICTKQFVVQDIKAWVYKRRTRSRRKNESILYMCSYPCTRIYDNIYRKKQVII